MDVLMTDDPEVVATRAAPFLHAERFTANVMAVEVTGIVAGHRALRAGSVWLLVEDQGRVVGAAMHTPPFNLHLARLPEPVVAAMARALYDRGRTFPGVSGEVATVERFLSRWESLSGAQARRRVAMRMYVLGDLTPPAGVDGASRRAEPGDTALVADWIRAFHAEAMPESPVEDVAARAGRGIASGQLWLWQVAGAPVSLAGSTPPAVGVARVGPVYTPPDRRRHGFGAAVTAVATQAALDAGAEHVVLYTDLSNPTSNAIYQAIGYRPDHDAGEWELV